MVPICTVFTIKNNVRPVFRAHNIICWLQLACTQTSVFSIYAWIIQLIGERLNALSAPTFHVSSEDKDFDTIDTGVKNEQFEWSTTWRSLNSNNNEKEKKIVILWRIDKYCTF